MTTGTKSKVIENTLKVAIAVCMLMALANLASIAYTHIPPFKEGECFAAPKQGVIALIERNNIAEGYSDVAATSNGITQHGPVAFIELRHPSFKKMECPK